MLYDQWLQIARDRRREIALIDRDSGIRWTFSDLATAAEAGGASRDRVVFPQRPDAEFVLTVLRAWRSGQVVCPLEFGQEVPRFADRIPEAIVHLKTTSATTGRARYVAFRPQQLMADADHIVQAMGLRPDWPNLGIISLAHSYGFSNLVLPLLLHGIPLILAGSPLPEILRQAAGGMPWITLPAVPALWKMWEDAGAIPKNVCLAISAGAMLPAELERTVYRHQGLKIHNFYGSSETGGIAFDSSWEPRSDSAYVGLPMAGVKVNVGRDGVLEVRGDAVAEKYWPEATPELTTGCFRTGDLGEIRNGGLFLRGRAGDQINVAGRKVSPEVIECVLASHPAVRRCVVFGVPSPEANRGELIVACVAVKGNLGAEALKEFLSVRVPAWQMPREWVFVEDLAVNARGKMSRVEWRARYLEQWAPRFRPG